MGCTFVRTGLGSGVQTRASGECPLRHLATPPRSVTLSVAMSGCGGSALPFPGTSTPRVPYPVSSPGFSRPRAPLSGAITEEQLLSCGANDCLMATAPGNSTQRPTQELIYTLLGIYTGVWAGACLLGFDSCLSCRSYKSLSFTQGRVPMETENRKGGNGLRGREHGLPERPPRAAGPQPHREVLPSAVYSVCGARNPPVTPLEKVPGLRAALDTPVPPREAVSWGGVS